MNTDKYKGLTKEEVEVSRINNGSNNMDETKKETILDRIIEEIKEPTFLLLFIAASIYFILGKYSDGIIMICCILFTCLIEFFEEYKTDKTLNELKKLTSINVHVIRDGKKELISNDDLVVGDIVILSEGDKVPADALILEMQGLGINESLLTGESDIVYKDLKAKNDNYFKLNMCYKGTDVINGVAVVLITAVGSNTEYGKIGTSLSNIKHSRSVLEEQVSKIVKIYGLLSLILSISVMIVSFINSDITILKDKIINSIISGVTIAIATIPEEIPLVITVFLAMGSWRLSKEKVLTKNIKSVENLGKITVLCTDKTGTITKNNMHVKETFELNNDFYESMYLSCSKNQFDNMEEAISKFAYKRRKEDYKKYELAKEYIFNTKDKMMGFIWKNKYFNNIYVKGAYENVIKLCNLTNEEENTIKEKAKEYSEKGLRIIAVASAKNIKIKEKITDYNLTFQGLVALEDPIREGISESIQKCYDAGIRIIMITGDSEETAKGIAKIIGLDNHSEVLTGDKIEALSDEELTEKVKSINIYARVYPNHKMRIVESLQKNNEVVAMTGDGINDTVAIKKADVGIAMGLRGTNICKEASDLILMDDNFNTIVRAIENGRGIYSNIKDSITYILAIHIPIALLSLVIPSLGYPAFLFPIHIVLSELLIDPTSSIIFERIPVSKNTMKTPPRSRFENIINKNNIIKCLISGLSIFAVVLISYLITVNKSFTLATTISYTVLILSIILMGYSLKSEEYTIKSLKSILSDRVELIINSFIIIILLSLIYIPFLSSRANMCIIGIKEWIYILILIIITVIPCDIYKKIIK